MAEFDKAFADKVLIVSARLARQEKFIGMDVIEDVLRLGAEVDAEVAQERRAAPAAANVPIDQRGVQFGDLVDVPPRRRRRVRDRLPHPFDRAVRVRSGRPAHQGERRADGQPQA
jgi:hypothetical protein